MKKFITFVFFITITFSCINNAFSVTPENFIKSTVDRAAKALGSNLPKDERINELKEIAKQTVDITGLGFYSLGAYKKKLNEEELKTYNKIFEKYFLKSFSSRLTEYSNPKIQVNSQKKISANYTIVSSTLVGTDTRPEVKIEWRVYTKYPDNLLIRDLIIEGLSLARTQKEEFSSIISSNDGKIEALLKNLSDFTNK
jgi:phospholipid transport system substrate-binding protein